MWAEHVVRGPDLMRIKNNNLCSVLYLERQDTCEVSFGLWVRFGL